MSSVHSQTSASGSGETGAQKTEKTAENGTGKDTRSSSGNSNKSTITFEKQKVVPRARTQSVQSVLSCISLRSMMGKVPHDEIAELSQQHSQVNNNNNNSHFNNPNSANNTVMNVPVTQQIQSPAMTSVQKRTSNSFFKDGIGQKLPFTDDRRRQLETDRSTANSRASTRNSHSTLNAPKVIAKESQSAVAADSGSSSGNSSSRKLENEPEDEAEQQKRLTTDALRRLSLMKNGNGSTVGSTNTDVGGGESSYATSSDKQFSEVADIPTFHEISSQDPSTLTYMQFGGKNIVLDSSIPNKRGSIAPIKDPLDKLPSTLEANTGQKSKSKRPVRQMCEPKKPLYTPAVLRDISETNITNAELGSPGPPVLPTPISNSHTTRSSVRSMRSTSSSILSDYTKKLGSLWNKDRAYSGAEVTRPTRDHWIADNKRHACHYCHRIFTFWERKHHCRHCGDIFCSQHVRHWLYLDDGAKFLIGGAGAGALSKICDGCLQEYDTLVREGPSVEAAQSNERPKSSTPVPEANGSSNQKGSIDEQGKRGRMDSIVGSVPADWNWSSF
ncbi:LAFA_0D10924g1_1 [Lachancea sp. 'fantastica']|nr:LAFA_0D10924g1_1 [Lachancea sp. 'fantastica']